MDIVIINHNNYKAGVIIIHSNTNSININNCTYQQ